MTNRTTFRDRLIRLLSEYSEEREDLLSGLSHDERRAVMYKWYQVPLAGRIDPNRIPEPPFGDREMRQLLQSAGDKIAIWVTFKIFDDQPTSLRDPTDPTPN